MSFDVRAVLKVVREKGASDLHLKANLPPVARIAGKLIPLTGVSPLNSRDITGVIESITSVDQRKILETRRALDLAYEDAGRHRVNIFYDRGTPSIAIRIIPVHIKKIKELNLPRIVENLTDEDRGLIIVTGAAGTGKSTTLASMVETINTKRALRIVTIEEPIEYVFVTKKSMISQREVGIDTLSFVQGLREALRADPNLIMVGEMRDLETMTISLQAAETGHLVLSTLHTLDAKETINRIINAAPQENQNEIRVMLASVLKAVISQRLVPQKDGLVPACEIMIVTPHIRDLILDPKRIQEIKTAISTGFIPYEMQSFEQSLFYLWKRKLITQEVALEFATQKENLALKMQGIITGEDAKYWEPFVELAKITQ